MLEDFADELKNARLKKGISLEEMAARTRIDIKFLEAIDNGNFGFLPELYVKAFIKDYAKVIDLDEEEVIRKYIDAKVGKHSEKDSSESRPEEKKEIESPSPVVKKVETNPLSKVDKKETDSSSSEKSKNSLRTLIYGSGIVIIGIIVFIAFFNKSSKVIVEEKPYEKVLEESENRYTVKEKKEESINQASVSDSLVLQIANIDPVDSAWVMIIYDDNKKEDFLLYPQRTKTVKALDNFKFTLGNSGVISLVLNNHKLNFAGVKGAVRHYIVSGDTIERLSSPPVLHSN
jgi:cytoskeletal protein RodZ